jgi:hypothetical protein
MLVTMMMIMAATTKTATTTKVDVVFAWYFVAVGLVLSQEKLVVRRPDQPGNSWCSTISVGAVSASVTHRSFTAERNGNKTR